LENEKAFLGLCSSLSLYYSFFVFFSLSFFRSNFAHPAAAGPENVQYRSVFIHFVKKCGSSALVSKPAPNPFLTHGTVESPAKLFPSSSLSC
jgi:hypothetical protein